MNDPRIQGPVPFHVVGLSGLVGVAVDGGDGLALLGILGSWAHGLDVLFAVVYSVILFCMGAYHIRYS